MNIVYLIGQIKEIRQKSEINQPHFVIKYLTLNEDEENHYRFNTIDAYFKHHNLNRYTYLEKDSFIFLQGKVSLKDEKLIIVVDEIVPLEAETTNNTEIEKFLTFGTKQNHCILKGTFLNNVFLLDDSTYYYGSIATKTNLPIIDRAFGYKKDEDVITSKFNSKGLFDIQVY